MQWNGVLIAASSGQPVQAVHYGRVIFADFFRGLGLLVIIDHGEGYLTHYAHNQLSYKKAGDTVKAGEAIATVGASGGQNTAGLYFEIRLQGKAIDPLAWLARV
jgi:septal ring factor EnvC (AmiA/AmiB activator)